MAGRGPNAADQRADMVQHLRRSGVRDAAVLDAMADVPRERFVPTGHETDAYQDHPLSIGAGQTISTPHIVAVTAAALELTPDDQVLEVGCGSGYAAAVLSRCARRVITVERHRELADRARSVLADLGYDNVEARHGDGTLSASERAPFDANSVAAMAPELPHLLIAQLAPHGRLVCPVGTGHVGHLIRLHRDHLTVMLPVSFVPLITNTGPTE